MSDARNPERPPPQVRLRPTMLSDLDFVVSVERDPANATILVTDRGGYRLQP